MVTPVRAANGGKTTALIETSPQPFMKNDEQKKKEVSANLDRASEDKQGKTVKKHLADQ